MPPANWDVDDALDEVIVAIKAGAGTFSMDSKTETGLRSGYRDDFKDRRDAGVEWNDVEARILALAVLVGSTAALFTSIKSASATGPLDENLTYAAAWLVARSSPECTGLVMTGGFCRNFPEPLGLSGNDLSALSRVSRLLGPLLPLVIKP